MPSVVSFRYANALADIVATPVAGKPVHDPQAIAAQVERFHSVFLENSELRIVFSTPAVSAEKKKKILGQVAASLELGPVAVNFLSVIVDHNRMALLGEIIEALHASLNERLGVAVADISSARPLEEAEKTALSGALNAKTGKKVRMNFSLDPHLIGGVVARIGSTIYDGSVRGSLDRLRAELKND
jgi:F-type H+-transporting ATPase subunit delta